MNILTSFSSWAQEAQTALFQLGAPIDPTTGKADSSFQVRPTFLSVPHMTTAILHLGHLALVVHRIF